MSFYGDLSSIAIGDLFQSFDANRSTGTFTLKSPHGTCALHFRDGQVSMMAGDSRPSLMCTLVNCGLITGEQLKTARARRKGSRKSLGEVLVAVGATTADDIWQAAALALQEDVCDLIANAEGQFDFKEGNPPPRVFDPEERRLDLGIRAEPLLLEAARRADHWELVRKVIPSDSVHFVAPPDVMVPADCDNPELMQRLLGVLDGTRDVREVAARFPRYRFAVYCYLSQLVRDRLVRAAEGEDLVVVAAHMAQEDRARARRVIARGLQAEPQHVGLLELEVRLARDAKDVAGAVNALKVLAHLRLDRGECEKSRDLLLQARELSPKDPSIWERLLALDLDAGAIDDAVTSGLHLVKLYREPGLDAKARDVLEKLVAVRPDSVELQRQLARARVDSGDVKKAVKELFRVGRRFVNEERYTEARGAYEEILAIDASQTEAAHFIELIDNETFAQRHRKRRIFVRRCAVVTFLLVLVTFLAIEIGARLDYAEATSRVSRNRLIEEERYLDAIELYEAVARDNPFAPTTFFDVRRRVAELQAKLPPR